MALPADSIWRASSRALLSLFGVGVIVFFLFNLLPGDPASLLAGKNADPTQVDQIREEMGLNESLFDRFIHFANDLSPIAIRGELAHDQGWRSFMEFDLTSTKTLVFKWPYLGKSYARNADVSAMIVEALPETMALVFAALFIALMIGVPLGMFAARTPNGMIDQIVRGITSAGLAIPSFVVAMLIAWFFGYVLHDYLGLSVTGSLFAYDYYAGEEVIVWANLVLPALALSMRPLAVTAQLMRNTMEQVLKQDYIRTARAKGLPERVILFRHALLNAINPIIHEVGAWITALLAGSVFVEFVFGYKGLGHLLLLAIEYQDFPVVIGLTLFTSATFILIQWLLSILSPIFDPSLASS